MLDRNLAKVNCTENHVCTSRDIVVLGFAMFVLVKFISYMSKTNNCDIAIDPLTLNSSQAYVPVSYYTFLIFIRVAIYT